MHLSEILLVTLKLTCLVVCVHYFHQFVVLQFELVFLVLDSLQLALQRVNMQLKLLLESNVVPDLKFHLLQHVFVAACACIGAV